MKSISKHILIFIRQVLVVVVAAIFIWTILIIGLIAAVAATVLFPVGQKIIQMGQDAAGKLQSPPW